MGMHEPHDEGRGREVNALEDDEDAAGYEAAHFIEYLILVKDGSMLALLLPSPPQPDRRRRPQQCRNPRRSCHRPIYAVILVSIVFSTIGDSAQ